MNITDPALKEAMLVMQVALLGEVSPRLRAVCIAVDTDKKITFSAFYDHAPTEEEYESMSCVETELIAYYLEQYTISHEVIQLNIPQKIPHTDFDSCVYHRKET